MKECKEKEQIPIFKFLSKHKWRIVLPLIFSLFYFSIPRYLQESVAIQQNIFYKSTTLSKEEMREEFLNIRRQILTGQSLANLISKYDLYSIERENNVAENSLIEKLENSIEIRLDDEANNKSLFIWIHFRKENSQNIAEFSREIMSRFEENPNIHIDKYVSEPYNASPFRNYVFFGGLLQGFTMIVLPLILIWEIPNIFYSPKTKKMVFEPLWTDWQNELFEAKLEGRTWNAYFTNARYTYAFLAAMWQKSLIGDLIEFFSKLAK